MARVAQAPNLQLRKLGYAEQQESSRKGIALGFTETFPRRLLCSTGLQFYIPWICLVTSQRRQNRTGRHHLFHCAAIRRRPQEVPVLEPAKCTSRDIGKQQHVHDSTQRTQHVPPLLTRVRPAALPPALPMESTGISRRFAPSEDVGPVGAHNSPDQRQGLVQMARRGEIAETVPQIQRICGCDSMWSCTAGRRKTSASRQVTFPCFFQQTGVIDAHLCPGLPCHQARARHKQQCLARGRGNGCHGQLHRCARSSRVTPAVAGFRPASEPPASSLSDPLLITSYAARRGARHPCCRSTSVSNAKFALQHCSRQAFRTGIAASLGWGS